MSSTSDVTVNLGNLLDAADDAMVTLVAGETQLVVHKAVLSARSPVFEAMFRHDTQEATSGVVSIPDVEGAVLRQLLFYCYSLQAPPPSAEAPQLLAAADKYGLPGLKAACEQRVAEQLAVENAAATALLAVRYSCPGLTAAAVDFIRANPQVMSTEGWTDAVLEYPEEVVALSRMVGDPLAKTRTPATTGGRPTASSQSGQNTPPPDASAVTYFRSLSGEKRGRWLIHAVKEGAVGEVRALVVVGVDMGMTDECGKTALHWAAQAGQTEIAKCLIQGGAYVGARDVEHRTPLHLAAQLFHADMVKLLLAASAFPDARDQDWRTPLHLAAVEGRAHVAAALLEAGADRWPTDSDGLTPLDIAKAGRKHRFMQVVSPR